VVLLPEKGIVQFAWVLLCSWVKICFNKQSLCGETPITYITNQLLFKLICQFSWQNSFTDISRYMTIYLFHKLYVFSKWKNVLRPRYTKFDISESWHVKSVFLLAMDEHNVILIYTMCYSFTHFATHLHNLLLIYTLCYSFTQFATHLHNLLLIYTIFYSFTQFATHSLKVQLSMYIRCNAMCYLFALLSEVCVCMCMCNTMCKAFL